MIENVGDIYARWALVMWCSTEGLAARTCSCRLVIIWLWRSDFMVTSVAGVILSLSRMYTASTRTTCGRFSATAGRTSNASDVRVLTCQ